jgi:hypothetical protein
MARCVILKSLSQSAALVALWYNGSAMMRSATSSGKMRPHIVGDCARYRGDKVLERDRVLGRVVKREELFKERRGGRHPQHVFQYEASQLAGDPDFAILCFYYGIHQPLGDDEARIAGADSPVSIRAVGQREAHRQITQRTHTSRPTQTAVRW